MDFCNCGVMTGDVRCAPCYEATEARRSEVYVLLGRIHTALDYRDWNAVLLLSSQAYGLACRCEERAIAEAMHDVVSIALLALEHPGLEQMACCSLVVMACERLNGGL
jgi:hypothetical protein